MGVLTDKVVAVTGAGRGIGRALALACAAEGAKVLVNDFGGTGSGEGQDEGPAHDVVKEIRDGGGEAFANTASIADPGGASSVVEDAVKAFGRIDAVVNNAGFLRDVIFHKMSIVDWDSVIGVHLNGSFYVAKAAAPYFKEQGSGSYVNFTSTSGLIGQFGQANYSAAKMGVVGLSTSIALDMQRFGVRSNCVAPFAWSRMTATLPTDTPEQRARVEKLQQMTPDKVAPLVVFLCSDAAKGVNGQVFGVRMNEIYLFNRPEVMRSIHRSDGWTQAALSREMMAMMQPNFFPLRRSPEVFSWDPI